MIEDVYLSRFVVTYPQEQFVLRMIDVYSCTLMLRSI